MVKNFVEYCKKKEGDLVGSVLDNDDLIDYERMQEYWDEYVKLFIPFVSSTLDIIDTQNEFTIKLLSFDEQGFKEWMKNNI